MDKSFLFRESTDGGFSPDQGFTLPEVLITLLLLSILFCIAIVFSSNFRHTRKTRDYEIAIALAQQAIDALRAAPFATIDDADSKKAGGSGSYESVETDLNNDNGKNDLLKPKFILGNVTYERNVEVCDVEPKNKKGPPLGLKYVKVTVTWKTPDGEEIQPYEITTTIADLN